MKALSINKLKESYTIAIRQHHSDGSFMYFITEKKDPYHVNGFWITGSEEIPQNEIWKALKNHLNKKQKQC